MKDSVARATATNKTRSLAARRNNDIGPPALLAPPHMSVQHWLFEFWLIRRELNVHRALYHGGQLQKLRHEVWARAKAVGIPSIWIRSRAHAAELRITAEPELAPLAAPQHADGVERRDQRRGSDGRPGARRTAFRVVQNAHPLQSTRRTRGCRDA